MPEQTLSFVQSVAGYFRLWRYGLGQILGLFLLMYLGWVSLAGGLLFTPVGETTLAVALGWLASTLILFAMFLVNDAADCDIDRIAHPERPIPRGCAAARHIYMFGVALMAVGVILSAIVSIRTAVIASVMAALAIAHYGYAKTRLKVPGSSEVITPVMSALFPLYALSVPGPPQRDLVLWVISFIYFADFAQDLLGGIHDEVGDRAHNVPTFAVAFGGTKALAVSFAAFLFAIVAGTGLFLTGRVGLVYLAVFLGLTVYMLYCYGKLFRLRTEALRRESRRVNHLAGGYFFLVSAAIFPDLMLRFALRGPA